MENKELQLIVCKNPFKRKEQEISVLKCNNMTLQSICEQFIPKDIEVYTSVNGIIIQKENRGLTIPLAGDQILIIPVISDEGDDKSILSIVLMIAVVWAAPMMVHALLPGLSTTSLMYSLAVGAVIVAGGILINSMMPQPQLPKYDLGLSPNEISQIYGWNPHSTQEQGLVTPKFYGKNKLFGNVIAVHTEIDEVDDTKQLLKMLISLGGGPVKGIVDGSLKINDQPVGNYIDVSIEERRGLLTQSVISFFPETKPEYKPMLLIEHDTPRTYTTPDNDFDDLEIELVFDKGIYYVDDSNNVANHSIGIKIEISEAGEDDWSTLINDYISGEDTSPIYKVYTASETYVGGSPVSIINGLKYDIKITKTSADETDIRYADQVKFNSIREVINDDFIYPLTALLGISALATSQISGSISVSCIQEGAIINVFDGENWSLEYNNNPAWVLYDVLTQPVISGDGDVTPYAVERYNGIDPSRIDYAKFYELAQFCDYDECSDGEGGTEKRITFNGGFDLATTVWEAALKICEIARCVLVWNGTSLTLAIDKAAEPVALFTVGDIIKDSFEETFLPLMDRASEIEIQYRDELQDFARTSLTVFDTNINNPSNKITLELFGITKQSEAWRAGEYRLAQNRYQLSIIKFEADINAIRCTIGDVVWVQHDVPEWGYGGHIISGDVWSILIDRDIVYEDGEVYKLIVKRKTDVIEEKTVLSKYNSIAAINVINKTIGIAGDFTKCYKDGDNIVVVDSTGNNGTYTIDGNSSFLTDTTTITVVESIPSAIIDGGIYNPRRIAVAVAFSSAPEAEEVYTFGVSTFPAKKYRIIGLQPDNNQKVTIVLIEYKSEVYGGDTEEPVIPITNYTSPNSSTSITKPLTWEQIQQVFPKQAVLSPVNIDVPITTNLIYTNNSPGAGSVAWSSCLLLYKGVVYTITASNTNKAYIYWDLNTPTVFIGTDTREDTIGANKWVMCSNESGTAYPSFIQKIISAGLIQASALSAISANLGSITSGVITLSLGGDSLIRIDSSGMYGSWDAGETWKKIIGVVGSRVTLAFDAYEAGEAVDGVYVNKLEQVTLETWDEATWTAPDTGVYYLVADGINPRERVLAHVDEGASAEFQYKVDAGDSITVQLILAEKIAGNWYARVYWDSTVVDVTAWKWANYLMTFPVDHPDIDVGDTYGFILKVQAVTTGDKLYSRGSNYYHRVFSGEVIKS